MRMLIVGHFVGGEAFFSGLGLLALAVVVSLLSWKKRLRGPVRVGAAAGCLVAWASATPSPLWLSVALVGSTLAWFVSHSLSAASGRVRRVAGALLLGAVAAGIAMEASWRLPPAPLSKPAERLYVIGDSMSAGMGAGESPWPEQLAARRRASVVNLAFGGATAADALAEQTPPPLRESAIVVFIGGNDLFGGTPAEVYEAGLNSLLSKLQSPHAQLVLLELPLPPRFAAYGRAQRRAAARFGALLVPKAQVASVICAPGATLDGLHLSERGHAAMADLVWRYVGPAMGAKAAAHQP